ncbi:phage integrase SAM-like domain-containing protein [uncultured Tenacibaculum sp.]|uniref:tyrosine-type recombinase/integrase n=1 Tax=uncultured Tenacibaculum sp. TaxID=174713 RepID=UPI00260BD3D1|nr:phage integrase SAM-like domain-containing protein [uncultured Tenacibaculum sp.]
MKGSIYLDTRKSQQSKKDFTFPLIVVFTGRGPQKRIGLKMRFLIENWNFNKEEPKNDKKLQLIVRRKKSLLDEWLLKALDDKDISYSDIGNVLKGDNSIADSETSNTVKKEIDFIKFGYEFSNEKRKVKSDKKGFKEGNSKVYDNALNQFSKSVNKINVLDIDYSTLIKFKNEQLILGNKKSTVNTYLRTLRAIYNEALRRLNVKVDPHPFHGVFNDVAVKKNRTKKRNVSRETIKILESLNGNLAKGQQDAVDLFLLQFYFGGQDLMDIYYLEKNQISKNGRIYITRGKLDEGGYEFDLKIFDKAKKILERLDKGKDNFLFPWRKDYKGYTNFRGRVNKNLKKVQENYNKHVKNIERLTGEEFHKIEVLPLEGFITSKVSRHTFATLGSRLYVEPDLLRALMGHEREDVDTIYKDVYPEEERDKFHYKIIDTTEIKTTSKYIFNLEYFNSEHIRSWRYRYFDDIPCITQLLEEVTSKPYTKPRYFKEIYLIKK